MKPDKVWTLYELSWPDGIVYIGQTFQDILVRLKNHRRHLDSLVGNRLRQGRVVCVREILSCFNQEEADTRELELIAEVPPTRRLNRPTIRPRQKTPIPPRDGRYRCNWCGGWYPPNRMSANGDKRNGIGYKCKDCYNGYSRVNTFFRRDGVYMIEQPGDCYAVAYRLSRRWVELGFDIRTLNAARMDTWSDDIWKALKYDRDVDDLIRFLAEQPPPPPPTWAEPGKMSCCGAPIDEPIPTSVFRRRHNDRSRNATNPSCEPARVCDRLYIKNGYKGVPVGKKGKPKLRYR